MNNTENSLANIHNYSIDPINREVYLHSYIGDYESDPGVDYRSAVVFEKNMRYLDTLSSDPIIIHMHLPGGDWEDCLGIYDTIKLCKSKTAIIAYGKAQSASSVILQAPNLRILMPNVNVMIHYGSMSLYGEHSKAATSNVLWNENESEKMVDIFTERCMSSPIAKEKNWKKIMAKKHIQSQIANKCDWILNAEESVHYGFADGILGDQKYTTIDHIRRKLKNKNAN